MKTSALFSLSPAPGSPRSRARSLSRRKSRPPPSPRLPPLPRDPRLLLPRHDPVRHVQDHRGLRPRDGREHFAADLEARRLEWLAVNVDEPANQHFVRDFQLYTRSVVVVDAKDPKRFKVLDRVWQLAHDKAAFQEYVEQEIRAFRRS